MITAPARRFTYSPFEQLALVANLPIPTDCAKRMEWARLHRIHGDLDQRQLRVVVGRRVASGLHLCAMYCLDDGHGRRPARADKENIERALKAAQKLRLEMARPQLTNPTLAAIFELLDPELERRSILDTGLDRIERLGDEAIKWIADIHRFDEFGDRHAPELFEFVSVAARQWELWSGQPLRASAVAGQLSGSCARRSTL